MTSSSENLSEEGISTFFVAFSALLTLVLVLSKLLHDRPLVASVLPEAGMILLVGMIVGYFVNLYADTNEDMNNNVVGDDDANAVNVEVAESLLSFSPRVFFVALLPPIIFNSGYHVRRELFFRHITPICLLAFVGTLVSAGSIALVLQLAKVARLTGSFQPTFTELLTFGGLISATDPVSTLAVLQSKRVDPQLFYLVYGESVLNDAVGLVLFNGLAKLVRRNNQLGTVAITVVQFFVDFLVSFVGSLALGCLSGIVAAFALKIVDMRSTPLLELSLYVLIMYVPYLMAETMSLSGIVTILFTGITARRYVVPNLSESTKTSADILFRLAAHLAETSIFLELGLSVFALAGGGHFVWRFILWSLLACLVGRALNVYPIVFLCNKFLRRNHTNQQKAGHTTVASSEVSERQDVYADIAPQALDQFIPSSTSHMVWFSGLRGAVAYACVRTFPVTFGHRRQFVVATMSIVLVTVFLMGGATEAALWVLKINTNVDEDHYMQSIKGSSRVSTALTRISECVYRVVTRLPVDKEVATGTPGTLSPSKTDPLTEATFHEEYQQQADDPNGSNIELANLGDEEAKDKESLYDFGSR